jgi:hypothetical protein
MLKTPEYLTPLEAGIISAIIEGFAAHTEPLSAQLFNSSLESRDYNGYGFYTTLRIGPDAPSCGLSNARLHADARVGGEHCGFMLWIKDGKITFLEGYPFEHDEWPRDETLTDLHIGKLD